MTDNKNSHLGCGRDSSSLYKHLRFVSKSGYMFLSIRMSASSYLDASLWMFSVFVSQSRRSQING